MGWAGHVTPIVILCKFTATRRPTNWYTAKGGKKASKTISILCWCCCWCRKLNILFVVAVFLLLFFFSVIEMRVGLWGWGWDFFFHYLTGNGAGSPDFHENAASLLYKLIPRFSLSLGRSSYLLWWNMSFFLVFVFLSFLFFSFSFLSLSLSHFFSSIHFGLPRLLLFTALPLLILLQWRRTFLSGSSHWPINKRRWRIRVSAR